MEIPKEIQLKATISQGSVYRFVDPMLDSIKPHFFVVLNKDPLSDEVLLLTCGTSQVENVVRRRRNVPSTTLVVVNPSDCDFLSKETIFDCNHIKKRPIETLIDKLKKKKLKMIGVISEDILDKLLEAVIASPLVSGRDKGFIK